MIPETAVIAIDGHVASGKGEASKNVSEALGFLALDTGLYYRAVARIWSGSVAGLQIHRRIKNDPRSGSIIIDGLSVSEKALRGEEITQLVPIVAKIPEVRAELLSIIREFAKGKKVVADGRDMGTVVFPDALLKIFLTAKPVVRAQRVIGDVKRFVKKTFEEVLADVLFRDHQDETRKDAPLKKADDAIVIDTSKLSKEQVANVIVRLWKLKTETI